MSKQLDAEDFVKLEVGELIPFKGLWAKVLTIDAKAGVVTIGIVGPTGRGRRAKRRGHR